MLLDGSFLLIRKFAQIYSPVLKLDSRNALYNNYYFRSDEINEIRKKLSRRCCYCLRVIMIKYDIRSCRDWKRHDEWYSKQLRFGAGDKQEMNEIREIIRLLSGRNLKEETWLSGGGGIECAKSRHRMGWPWPLIVELIQSTRIMTASRRIKCAVWSHRLIDDDY